MWQGQYWCYSAKYHRCESCCVVCYVTKKVLLWETIRNCCHVPSWCSNIGSTEWYVGFSSLCHMTLKQHRFNQPNKSNVEGMLDLELHQKSFHIQPKSLSCFNVMSVIVSILIQRYPACWVIMQIYKVLLILTDLHSCSCSISNHSGPCMLDNAWGHLNWNVT